MLLKNSAGELELQEGKLTLRELSLWFGLAPTTISNGSTKSKEKKFNILKGYAVYHFEGRNIIIDKVTLVVNIIVNVTLIFTICIAKLLGCTLPLLAKKAKLDPAVMINPFITTLVDACSLIIYFKIATQLLGL